MALQVEVFNKKMLDIVDCTQELTTIAGPDDGLIFTEGPIWNHKNQYLLFSDIAGNIMYRWDDTNALQPFVPYSFKANGNAWAKDGGVVTCEHATSRMVSRDEDGGNYRVLASHFQGKELNSPNDVVVKSDGSVYFSDPFFGRNPSRVGVERKQQLDFQGVFRLEGDVLILLDKDFGNPNGLCFSKDEKSLFINDSPRKEIKKFAVAQDGTLSDGYIWATTQGDGPGLPDGMKLDVEENLYCCAQGGIHVYDKNGLALGRIVIPVQAANFTFGGKDNKQLFICATDHVFHMEGKISGL